MNAAAAIPNNAIAAFSADEDTALLRFSRRAMATMFELVFPWGTPNADSDAKDALALIDRLEAQLTVYRPTSEVSRLNRIAAFAPVPIEAELFDLLLLAKRLTSQTAGAFDVTAGPLIKAWGFFQRQGSVPEVSAIIEALTRVGMAHVWLNPENKTVRYDRTGVEINLGSIGKGYALDRVAGRLGQHWHIETFLLNSGTSSVLARGGPWPVGIKHPGLDHRLGILRLTNRGLAVSGASFQHFAYNGRRLGHLLDPRTGWPAEGIALAAAVAPTAAEADALATAFFVLGVDGTRDYVDAHPEVSAIVLPAQPDSRPVTYNLTDDDWVLSGPDARYPDAPAWDAS